MRMRETTIAATRYCRQAERWPRRRARFVVAMTSSARLISPRLAGSGNGFSRLAVIWRRVVHVTPSVTQQANERPAHPATPDAERSVPRPRDD
jgi:hypothetical protein